MIRAVFGIALACTLSACSAPDTHELDGVVGDSLPVALADEAGSPERGAAVFAERDQGHCVLCHQLSSVDAPFQGNLGPALDGVGARLSPGQIRLRIAAPHRVWPDTVMPSYYRRVGLQQVDPTYEGETILMGRQIEDLVAFLTAQTAPLEGRDEHKG